MHIQVVTFTSEINRSDYESMVIEGSSVGCSSWVNYQTFYL